MDTSLELKNKELVAKNTELVTQIGIHANVENTYKVKVETIKLEVEAIKKKKQEKLGELSSIEKDLEVARLGAAKEKPKLMAELDATRVQISELTAKFKSIELDLTAIEKKLTEARELLKTESQALEVVMAEHEAFKAHAASEKARILEELKALDDTAKEQVVVIQNQSTQQLLLDNSITAKKSELTEIDNTIDTATKKAFAITGELSEKENTYKLRTQEMENTFKARMEETEIGKMKATEQLQEVTMALDMKNAQAVALVGREEEVRQREQFLKDRYAKANIAW